MNQLIKNQDSKWFRNSPTDNSDIKIAMFKKTGKYRDFSRLVCYTKSRFTFI